MSRVNDKLAVGSAAIRANLSYYFLYFYNFLIETLDFIVVLLAFKGKLKSSPSPSK